MESNHPKNQVKLPLFSNSQNPRFITFQRDQGEGLTFFYEFCQGQLFNKSESGKPPLFDGFFILIIDILKNKSTFFFLKRAREGFSVDKIKRVEEKEVNVNQITKISEDGKRIRIYFQEGKKYFYIKCTDENYVKEWRVILQCNWHNPKQPIKAKSQRNNILLIAMDNSQKLGSTNSSTKRENAQNLLVRAKSNGIIQQEEKGSSKISEPGKDEQLQKSSCCKVSINRETSKEIEKLNEKLRLSERKINELILEKAEDEKAQKEEIEGLTIKLKRKQEQNVRLLKEIEEQKKATANLIQKISIQQKHINDCEQDHRPLQQRLRNHQQNEASLNKKIEQLSMKISKLTKQLQRYQQSYRQIHDKCQKYAQTIQLSKYSHLFPSQLFEPMPIFKKQLTLEIQTFSRRKIAKSRLIYRMDLLNKVNFHNYIDGKENIVVVALTTSGFYLAAFSESAIMPKSIASDGGLLISLSNNKSFKCLPERRSVVFDDYYIIFGNSEFRIKSQQAKIFSNFGIANCHYASNDHKVDVLLGSSSREVDLESYEVYQLLFQ